MSAPRLLFLVTEDWYFCSHRLPVARAARDAGWRVSVACRVDRHGAAITREGFHLVPLSLSRRSLNPLREAAALREIAAVYRRERPDVVHHVALKPVLYGSIAARLAGVRGVVNAFAGLGHAFSSRDPRRRLLRAFVSRLLRVALRGSRSKVIVQNRDDADTLVRGRIMGREDIVLIRGSGVDLERFRPAPEPAGDGLVVLPSRMIWEKGVGEFVQAARRLRREGSKSRFALVGEPDADNPAAVPAEKLREWKTEGAVEVWGRRDDMPAVLAQSWVVCLPSFYGEGVPKSLIEAAAAGRPIVTTDMPGCREVVLDGETGLLVAPRDADALARALKTLLRDPDMRLRMGAGGRRLAEREFDEARVARETLAVYRGLLPKEKA
ncbi:MAG: glycosyltransferase family 4 protein [Elusimicrobiota bacterium]|nr:glycosyltransferase family 4 protein [Elusimicrobiota bacterium]